MIVPAETGVEAGSQGVAMTTNEFAAKIGNLGPSIHRRVCLTGSYFGIKPTKLPNGRLLWPDDAVEQLIAQHQAKPQEPDRAAA